MRRILCLLLVLLGQPARAETISVQAGEHADFTRIVLQLQGPAGWQMGRTEAGYEIRIDRQDMRYDLTSVFRAIPRSRLQSVWTDPETGTLRLGLGCACHAIAFEFRPDVIVIDLRDGPPPAGSSFETALRGGQMAALVPKQAIRPRTRPGSGLPLPLAQTSQTGQADMALALTLPSPDLDAARISLLQELSRAASAGVIEIDPTALEESSAGLAAQGPPSAGLLEHLETGGAPGLSAFAQGSAPPDLTAEGRECLADAALNLPEWVEDESFDDAIATRRAGLVGEFDRTDPAAVGSLTQAYLYFGFGAEARAVLAAFPGVEPERAIWLEMATLLDGGSLDGNSLLSTQAACSGTAALWASLALPKTLPKTIDRSAVKLGFSALPLHLRRQLGPALAEKFLAAGDTSTAQAIREAIRRAPGPAGPQADLLDAKLDQSRGDLVAGEALISDVAGEGGPTAVRALVDLVDARLAQGLAIDGSTIADLEALARENQGGPLAQDLYRAEMLARGSAGDFDTAFRMADTAPPQARLDLWRLLIAKGPDSAILDRGILDADSALPAVDAAERRTMALRLVGLGFPSDALRWLPGDAEAETVLIAARADLLLKDARGTLRGLAGMTDPQAQVLRAGALTQLGDLGGAARAYEAANAPQDMTASLWRARDWQAGLASLPEAARPAIATLLSPLVEPALPNTQTPLADGRALVAESAGARDAVLALISAVPSPAAQQP